MNSGFTSERVYGALKRRLLSGEFKPGDRLDPALLSDTLSSSVTPVRDVLNILRGEGLVETRTGEGFFRPHITAPDLEDLYEWSDQLIALSLRGWSPSPTAGQLGGDRIDSVADRTAELFLAIAAQSSNQEYARAVQRTSDQLHAVRQVEQQVLDNIVAELNAVAQAIRAGHNRELARIVSAYHRRRRRSASEIVRALYRG